MKIRKLSRNDGNLIASFGASHDVSEHDIDQVMRMLGNHRVIGVFADDKRTLLGIVVCNDSTHMVSAVISDVDVSGAVSHIESQMRRSAANQTSGDNRVTSGRYSAPPDATVVSRPYDAGQDDTGRRRAAGDTSVMGAAPQTGVGGAPSQFDMISRDSIKPPASCGDETGRKRGNKAKAIVIAIIALAIIGGISAAAYLNREAIGSAFDVVSAIISPDEEEDEHWQIGEDESAELVIEPGDTVFDVQQKLYDLGFASTADVIYETLDESNHMSSIQAATYVLLGDEEPEEIIERLVTGVRAPKGYIGVNAGDTMRQICAKFDDNGLPFGSEDMTYADDPQFYKDDYEMLSAVPDDLGTLEGFIPEGVYDCHLAKSADAAMRIMLDAGEERYEESGKSPEDWYEYLTVASMIDKEVFFDDEKPLVASVIYNRIDKKMKLGIDATVKYALGSDAQQVTYDMLEVDSPYNTYKVDGLPIGPICSGISDSSIEAAESPADTDYIYYVLKDKEGHHAFSSTYDQFEKDKDAYLELFGLSEDVNGNE